MKKAACKLNLIKEDTLVVNQDFDKTKKQSDSLRLESEQINSLLTNTDKDLKHSRSKLSSLFIIKSINCFPALMGED